MVTPTPQTKHVDYKLPVIDIDDLIHQARTHFYQVAGYSPSAAFMNPADWPSSKPGDFFKHYLGSGEDTDIVVKKDATVPVGVIRCE